MKRTAQNRFKALTSACVLSMMATVAWSQTLTWLGTLGGDWSSAFGVSADGSVVVGRSRNSTGQEIAFRWTALGGMQPLDSRIEEITDFTPDGSVLVGYYRVNWEERAFRWTVSGGIQDLGTLPGGDRSEAYAVSADGSVVVGRARNAAGQWRAFRWTQATGMQDLGTLGGYSSMANDVSADGSVVVGYAVNADGLERAFRWTEAGGMQDLGVLPNYDEGYAVAVSADGQVVLGVSKSRDFWRSPRVFRWTPNGMQDLGGPYDENPDYNEYFYIGVHDVSVDCSVAVGYMSHSDWPVSAAAFWRDYFDTFRTPSIALAVSDDGSVVLGDASIYVDDDYVSGPVRWRQGNLENFDFLNITYARLLADGSYIYEASEASFDGRYIVGTGYNAATQRVEAFLLDTGTGVNGDVNGDGCVDDSDLLQVLFAFGDTGSRLPEDLNGDGTVDDADLLEVLFNFGSGC